MPELIVTAREIRYGRKALARGERFEASEKDAKVLKAIGKAEDAPPKPVRRVAETKAPARKVEAEDAPAAPPVVEPTPEPEEKPARATRAEALSTDDVPAAPRYSTRRLKAED
jgi:hypothetical protein